MRKIAVVLFALLAICGFVNLQSAAAAPGQYLGQEGARYFFVWPTGVAVDHQGNVYIVDTDANRVQKYDNSGKLLTTWGREGSRPGQFNGPMGIALDSGGDVYVADSGNNRVQKFTRSGRLLAVWGPLVTTDGTLSGPEGIAVDRYDNFYVTDLTNGKVHKFDRRGNYLSSFGSLGTGPGELWGPLAVAVDRLGYVYVVSNFRVTKFNGTGGYVTHWSTPHFDFGNPIGIAVDHDDNLYVAQYSGWILKYDQNGNLLAQWGGPDATYHAGIAVDRHGFVYVTNADVKTVQKFSPSGTPLSTWAMFGDFNPGPVAVDADGYVYVFADGAIHKFTPDFVPVASFDTDIVPVGLAVSSSGDIYAACAYAGVVRLSSSGTVLGTWTRDSFGDQIMARSVALGGNGLVYVTDTLFDRVRVFDASGTLITQWGGHGSSVGTFTYPSGIAIDIQGDVYVADSGNHRVQKFDASGTFLASWGSSGSGTAQLSYPTGIAADAAGNIYVSDFENNRVQVFDTAGTYKGSWGRFGSANGEFIYPSMVAVNAAGTLVYVLDQGNDRVQWFVGYGAAQFGIFVPSSVTVDTPFTFSIIALDVVGDVATGFTGPVVLGSSDPSARLPGTAVLHHGAGMFRASFGSVGRQTIRAEAESESLLTGTSKVINVRPRPLPGRFDHLLGP